MKNSTVHLVGKYSFWSSFLAGNICLFGYLIFKQEWFAIAGYFLLIFGSILNIAIIIGLIFYAFYNKERMQDCFKAILIMLINIPIAALYTCIGLEIL